jgi:hypothetical protein
MKADILKPCACKGQDGQPRPWPVVEYEDGEVVRRCIKCGKDLAR